MKKIRLWHYKIPSDRFTHEGWAEIVIGSNGFFAAISDFGNYCYQWNSMGVDDAREFFLRASTEWDYFARKLGGDQASVYDNEETLKAVKSCIKELRKNGILSPNEAKNELDLLEDFDCLNEREHFILWANETNLQEAWTLRRQKIDTHLEIFCKVTMAKLSQILFVDLAAPFRAKSNKWFRNNCSK